MILISGIQACEMSPFPWLDQSRAESLKISIPVPDLQLQITKFREFNAISALNEDGQTPDCSGIFETTTGVYTDIIQTNTSVLETTWSLIDPTNLILKLDSFKELTAN